MKLRFALSILSIAAILSSCSNPQEEEKARIRAAADSLKLKIEQTQHELDSIKEADGWNKMDSLTKDTTI